MGFITVVCAGELRFNVYRGVIAVVHIKVCLGSLDNIKH